MFSVLKRTVSSFDYAQHVRRKIRFFLVAHSFLKVCSMWAFVILRPEFFISGFTNPPTLIFQKVEISQKIVLVSSANSKYYLFS